MMRDNLRVDVCYRIRDTKTYFTSPDGIGVYWYESLDEYVEAHGKPDRVVTVNSLTDY